MSTKSYTPEEVSTLNKLNANIKQWELPLVLPAITLIITCGAAAVGFVNGNLQETSVVLAIGAISSALQNRIIQERGLNKARKNLTEFWENRKQKGS